MIIIRADTNYCAVDVESLSLFFDHDREHRIADIKQSFRIAFSGRIQFKDFKAIFTHDSLITNRVLIEPTKAAAGIRITKDLVYILTNAIRGKLSSIKTKNIYAQLIMQGIREYAVKVHFEIAIKLGDSVIHQSRLDDVEDSYVGENDLYAAAAFVTRDIDELDWTEMSDEQIVDSTTKAIAASKQI